MCCNNALSLSLAAFPRRIYEYVLQSFLFRIASPLYSGDSCARYWLLDAKVKTTRGMLS